MERAEFLLSIAAGFFSVYLLGWRGYQGASADWVYGFLTVFWSLIMMLRLMTLTTPATATAMGGNLAQKIIATMQERQEENRQTILENSFGGSFVLFLFAGFVFAAWQIYCAAFPAQAPAIEGLAIMVGNFFQTGGTGVFWAQSRAFDWGQGFMLLLSLSMMGFVLRSHAAERGMTRTMLLVLCGYAAAGFLAFAGLDQVGTGAALAGADLVGNGAGAASFLLGVIPEGRVLSLFDILLLDGGIIGLSILTFLIFIPLGYICLAAQNGRVDTLVVACGLVIGSVMILSVFLSFTPAIGGFLALCWMGLFLAWGAAENSLQPAKA